MSAVDKVAIGNADYRGKRQIGGQVGGVDGRLGRKSEVPVIRVLHNIGGEVRRASGWVKGLE